MSTDLLLYVLLGLVQTATAVWGGIVSVKSLPVGRERIAHIAAFVLMFIIGSSLIVWSGIRAFDIQKANDKAQKKLEGDLDDSRRKLDQSLLAQEYMKGQLNSISVVMSNIGEGNTSNMKYLATAISKMAVTTNAKAAALSDRQLIDRAIELARRMRAFELQYRALSDQIHNNERRLMMNAKTDEERSRIWNENNSQSARFYDTKQYEFRTTLLGEAIYYRDELLKRLPAQPDDLERKLVDFGAFSGSLAGPTPISDAADYLEKLARKLSP